MKDIKSSSRLTKVASIECSHARSYELCRNEVGAGTTPLEKVTDADYKAPAVGPD
jgi:hypothetical protein